MSNISMWMANEYVVSDGEKTVYDACVLMKEKDLDAIMIAENDRLKGIFTEHDLLHRIILPGKDSKKVLIKEVMTENIKTINIETEYKQVYDLMLVNNIQHLPVLKDGKMTGLVYLRDLLRFNTRTMEKNLQDQEKEIEFIRNMLDETNDERNRKLYMENLRLQSLIRIDDLTGLYNHKYFEEILVKEMARAKRYHRPVTLLFLDIDYFKHYNDINGHEAGNVVLKQLADILKNTSRQSDTAVKVSSIDIVARYGGEEFVIVLPETDKNGGFARSERILKDVREYSFVNRESQPNGKLTISIGVAEFPNDAIDWSDLIKRADEALYKAKNKGRDRVV
ncbi:MAG: GGDEF domain-containing protein [Candidatus Omnitrophica bacterium]|nr:GGDEF domain-containing protein [Candidatus Omnitrophota bacterium]